MLKHILAAACLLGLSTSGAMAQQPIPPVPMTPFGDGQDSVLMGDLTYQIGNTSHVIVVPTGFVTDFASVPRAFWAVLPPFGNHQLAAIVHDFLYWDQGCTREQADALLRVGMAESAVEAGDARRHMAGGACVRRHGMVEQREREGGRPAADCPEGGSQDPAPGDLARVPGTAVCEGRAGRARSDVAAGLLRGGRRVRRSSNVLGPCCVAGVRRRGGVFLVASAA